MRTDQIDGNAVLLSRGASSLPVTVTSPTGAVAVAGALARASTDIRRAVELRDVNPARYGGQGVRGALKPVTGLVTGAVTSRDGDDRAASEAVLRTADRAADTSRLGAKTIVGVHGGADAVATDAGIPSCRRLAAEGSLPVCRCRT